MERRRLDESLAERIRPIPGVERVVPDRSVYARLVNGRAVLHTVGHGWASTAVTPYRLTDGHAPRTAGEVVVARASRFHAGDRVRVLTAEGSQWFAVSGTAHGPAPAVFFRDDVAAMLSADARHADLLAIVTRPEADGEQVADRVHAALQDSPVRVLTGAKRGDAESPDDVVSRDDYVAGLTVFGVLAAFIAIFVVASTFALSVQQRHRELALFRAIGATPRQVRRMVAAEALLLAVVAFVVAAPLGVAATFLERGLFSRVGIGSAGLHVIVGPLPLVLGLVGAVVTTQLAAFASARRAARIHPTEALRDAAVQRRVVSWPRALAGLALLAAGIAAVRAVDADDAPAGTMILMLAAALLGPLIALPFVWLLGLPLSALSHGPGMLARANTRANLRRAAAVATPVMLAVSLVCTLYFGQTALQQQMNEQTD